MWHSTEGQQKQYTYKRNTEACSPKYFATENKKKITQSECVCVCVWVGVALVIQHATRMRRIILSFVTCLPLLYFSTLLHKPHHFRKNVTEHNMSVLIFSIKIV